LESDACRVTSDDLGGAAARGGVALDRTAVYAREDWFVVRGVVVAGAVAGEVAGGVPPGPLSGEAAYGAVVAGVALAWLAWPAKTLVPPTFRVAAVQGNIPQSVKARPEAFAPTLARYTALTLALRKARVKLVLWPETVIVRALRQAPAQPLLTRAVQRVTCDARGWCNGSDAGRKGTFGAAFL